MKKLRHSFLFLLTLLFVAMGRPVCAQSHMIVFYPNGGEGFMDTIRATQYTSVTLPNCTFTRAGYLFNGWVCYTDASHSDSTIYANRSVVSLNANMHLYARWQSNCNDILTIRSYATCGVYYWGTADTIYQDTVIEEHYPIAGGCDSVIRHQFIIHPLYDDTVAISACDSVAWSAALPWIYHDTMFRYRGLSIHNCDSIHTTLITLHHAQQSHVTLTGCDSLTWDANGVTYYASAADTAVLTTLRGCDSTVSMALTLHPSFRHDTIVAACDSLSWEVDGRTYLGDTVAVWQGSTQHGCDSIHTMALTIHHAIRDTSRVTACDSSLWEGLWYYEDTAVSRTYSTLQGCDSTRLLLLTLHPSYREITAAAECDSFYWDRTASYYTADTLLAQHHTTIHGCDSTTGVSVTIHPSFHHDTAITACDSLLWEVDGLTYRSDILSTWMNLTSAGCDSIYTLTLTLHYSTSDTSMVATCDSIQWKNNNYLVDTTIIYTYSTSEGCDSTQVVNLTVYSSHNITVALEACDSFYWDQAGCYLYADTVLSQQGSTAQGCDSIVHTQLAIYEAYSKDTAITACNAYLWPVDGNSYSRDTLVTWTGSTAHGCDSIHTLALTLHHSAMDTTYYSGCDSIEWAGLTFHDDTTILQTFTPLEGCDSIQVLLFDVHHSSWSVAAVEACDSFYWDQTGVYYSADTLLSSHHTSQYGCDSTVSLALTIHPSYVYTATPVVCDSFYWTANSQLYTTSADDTLRYSTQHGCDSLRILHLTLNSSREADNHEIACDSLFWQPLMQFLYADTLLTQTLATTGGCDSLVRYHITINQSFRQDLYDSVCEGEVYVFNGQSYYNGGTFFFRYSTTQGCDSTLILHLAELDRPTLSVTYNADCSNGYYELRAFSTAPYFLWSALPDDPFLGSHESDATIYVKPTRDTRYTVVSDYRADMSRCPVTQTLELEPIVQPTAELNVTPEILTFDDYSFHAIDRSHNATRRAWYVDGNYISGEPQVWYTADIEADSVELMLVAATSTCNDTVFKVLPFRRDPLYVPNAFTPDQSTNNIFRAYGDGITDYSLYIYNRDGLLVFESHDLESGWDGRGPDGTTAPQGSYVYLIRYQGASMPKIPKIKKGTVTLIR